MRDLSIYDVVIADAGPVGLFLACELRLADFSVLVPEQAEDPYSPLTRLPFGMRGLSIPTIEAFYRRGLLDDIAAAQLAKDQPSHGNASTPHWIAMVDFDGGAYHRTQPIALEHVQTVLSYISGTDVTLTALQLATTWTDRAYQATAYRKGRVLLAGDAAHIHSPLGGQGLNLGLGDAMNLGWKLAATPHGDAPADLLDSYSSERHPIRAQILDWSRAQVALMRPTPSSRALEAIIRDIIATRDGATYFAERVWGASLRYDFGRSHPLVGCSVPDFELIDGTKLGELLRKGNGLFVDFDASTKLRALARGWDSRITYIASDVKDRPGLSAVLVRPDGIVVCAGDTAYDGEEAVQALSRWFGAPARYARVVELPCHTPALVGWGHTASNPPTLPAQLN